MCKSENPEMKRRPFIWQHVTFANVFFFRFTFIQRWRAGPIPTVTRRHWKSNIAQRGAMAQMRAALTFQISCSISAAPPPPRLPPPPNPTHPPTLWRPRKWFPDCSSVWGRGAVHASPVCVRWQVPGGARWQPVAHYFSWRPGPCWDVCGGTVKIASPLRRKKCGGFSFQKKRRGSGS